MVTGSPDNRCRAVVEIGSGSIKVVVGSGSAVERHRFATDLMAELGPDERLSDRGRQRLDEVLGAVARILGDQSESGGVESVRVVGTQALRTVPLTEVSELVAARLNTSLEVLSGEAEAELGLRAVLGRSVVGDGPTVVTIDIGYGSTELATRLESGDVATVSLPIGAETVTSDFLHHDPPLAAELSAALSVIDLHFDDLIRESPGLAAVIAGPERVIVGLGVSRYVAEVELGVADGDRIDGCQLERVAAEEVFRALATESFVDRAANPGLDPNHVSWIVGAMCVLLGFMRRFGVDEMTVSTVGVADGLLASPGAPPPPVGGLGS